VGCTEPVRLTRAVQFGPQKNHQGPVTLEQATSAILFDHEDHFQMAAQRSRLTAAGQL
jgi:hypothetical protein